MERRYFFLSVTHFIMLCTVLTLLVGCSGKNDPETQGRTDPETAEVTLSAGGKRQGAVIEETEYYQVFKDNYLYSYVIYDKNGNIITSAENLTKQPKFTVTDSDLLRVVTQAGTGIGTQSGFYYDVEKNLISPIYPAILCQQGNLVAYATQSSVIVQDIFYTNGFRQEISAFSSPFARTAFPFISASFTEDRSYICVTYLSGENYIETLEMFELQPTD